MLLSIVIPAYCRPDELRLALDTFVRQIHGRHSDRVELIVVDDASPDHSLDWVAGYAEKYAFLQYRRLARNIGLEKNLLASSDGASGEFLWIFGDDDFLETDDAMDDIIARLERDDVDMLVLNRSRRDRNLTNLLTPNWMEVGGPSRRYQGLREFCLCFGYLSVIGFISVNIFRREPFKAIDASYYAGTMYPQLGAMVEAFHDRPVELVTRPLVCHRTHTAEEKRATLGSKAAEADFMADARKRDSLYFSHPHYRMMDRLIRLGAFNPEDLLNIPENTVHTGPLIDFFLRTAELSLDHSHVFTDRDWQAATVFFDRIPMDSDRRARFEETLAKQHVQRAREPRFRSVSVISPSFNQVEFLPECLETVREQTVKPVEHLVFDPGSSDGSREVARAYPHVTLVEKPDRGQSDALNSGFVRFRGDILCWLNSDDALASNTVFERVLDRFNQPDQPDIVFGRGRYINEKNETLRPIHVNDQPDTLSWKLQEECGISQPALFMHRSVIERVGLLSEDNHFSMDYEYWIRCVKAGIRFAFIDEEFSLARYHSKNKTYGERGKSYSDVARMLLKHFGYVNHKWLRRWAEYNCEGHDGVLAHSGTDGISDVDALEREYNRLLLEYNGSAIAWLRMCDRGHERGYGDTLAEMRARGLDPIEAHNIGAKVVTSDTKWVEASRVSMLPTISIVTPNYNGVGYIDEAMKSVLGQYYPKLEYIVVDGASTDGSVAKIEARHSVLSAFISEPDQGHSDALNKGFGLSTGDIMGWVNSDDLLLPGALASVARLFAENPDLEWITARPTTVDQQGESLRFHDMRRFSRLRFLSGQYRWVQQESTFWRRSLWEKAGGQLDPSMMYACDLELWVRFFRFAELYSVDIPIGAFRQRPGQRSAEFLDDYEAEALRVIQAEREGLDPDFVEVFGSIIPDKVTPLHRDEVSERERTLSLADAPDLGSEIVLESGRPKLPTVIRPARTGGKPWREALVAPDDLGAWRDMHRGERCFVMGNGPSLNKMNLNKLKGETVFACNSVFLLFDKIDWRPRYYSCVDSRVLPDRAADINRMLDNDPNIHGFFPSEVRQYTGEKTRYAVRTLVTPASNRTFFQELRQSDDNLPFSMFSTDAIAGLVQPFTVSVTLLQLAHHMGFSKIYLIGCDTSYVIPDKVKKEGLTSRGEIGLALTSEEDDDPNHFDPSYFGKGRKWHDPQVDKMIDHHAFSRAAVEETGRSIIYNATVGGNLEVYERVDFDSLFNSKAGRRTYNSAIKGPTGSDKVVEALLDDAILAATRKPAGVADPDPMPPSVIKESPTLSADRQASEVVVLADIVGGRSGITRLLMDAGGAAGSENFEMPRLTEKANETVKTDPTFHEAKDVSPTGRAFYGQFGDWAARYVPPLYQGGRLVRRVVTAIWRRKLWTFPTMLLAVAVIAVSFAPQFRPDAVLIWLALSVLMAFAGLGYLALSTRRFVGMLARQNENLAGRLKESEARLANEQCRVETSLVTRLGGRLDRIDRHNEVARADLETRQHRMAETVNDQGRSLEDQRRLLSEQSKLVEAANEQLAVFIGEEQAGLRKALEDRIAARLGHLEGYLGETVRAIRDEVLATRSEYHDATSRTAAELNEQRKLAEAAGEQQGEHRKALEDRIAGRLGHVEARLDGAIEAVRDEVRATRSEYHDATSRTAAELNEQRKLAEATGEQQGEHLKALEDRIAGRLGHVEARLDGAIEAVRDEVSSSRSEYHDAIAQTVAEIREREGREEAKREVVLSKLAEQLNSQTEAQTSELRSEVRQVRQGLEQRMHSEIDEYFDGIDAALRGHFDGKLQELEGLLGRRLDESDAKFSQKLGIAQTKADDAISHVIKETKESVERSGQRIEEIESEIADRVRSNMSRLESETGDLKEGANAFQRDYTDRMDATTARFATVEANLRQYDLVASGDTGFLRFNRFLMPSHIDTFLSFWARNLDLNLTPEALHYIAKRIRTIEAISAGRLATQIEDAVLRCLIAMSVKSKTLDVLEIGVLFGVGLSIIYDQTRDRFDKVRLTALDPLDGYYGTNQVDTLLKVPVTEETFWRNMRVAAVPTDDIHLIKRLSTDDAALTEAAVRRYDMIVIDGDHTYGGVKADFDNYLGLVKRGGFVIIDDYTSEDWPSVTEFVDREVMPRKDIALVGADWRTAVFRVTEVASSGEDGVSEPKPVRRKRVANPSGSRSAASRSVSRQRSAPKSVAENKAAANSVPGKSLKIGESGAKKPKIENKSKKTGSTGRSVTSAGRPAKAGTPTGKDGVSEPKPIQQTKMAGPRRDKKSLSARAKG